jgi:DNA-binding MarR family transcriptional regulator
VDTPNIATPAATWTIDEATGELLAVLPLLNRIVASAVRRETGEETTMPQFRVLAMLAERPQTTSGLARHRRVSLPAMGALVQALVERGWVTRVPDPNDRRQHMLELTTAGLAHYRGAQEQVTRQLSPLLSVLSEHELRAVQIALPALHRALTSNEEPEPDVVLP